MSKITRILCLTAISLFAAAPASALSATTIASPTLSAPAAQGLVPVTSPWGYTDLYYVHRGWNCLRCSGTGGMFQFYWRGC